MIHPDTALAWISPEVGHGVVATRRIPRGTITWVLDPLDQLIDDVDVPERFRPIIDKYTYRTAGGARLLAWDLCRYMNHSCEANTFSPGLDLEIAIRDIEVGEQLTSDYAALNLEEGEGFVCCCGAPTCRRWVGEEQFELLASGWDDQLRRAFTRLARVPQPLWELVGDPAAVLTAAQDRAKVPSVLTTRYPGPRSGARHRATV